MLSRLHSTNTLVDGMSLVASTSSSRKRELEQKIQEPCIYWESLWCWCRSFLSCPICHMLSITSETQESRDRLEKLRRQRSNQAGLDTPKPPPVAGAMERIMIALFCGKQQPWYMWVFAKWGMLENTFPRGPNRVSLFSSITHFENQPFARTCTNMRCHVPVSEQWKILRWQY